MVTDVGLGSHVRVLRYATALCAKSSSERPSSHLSFLYEVEVGYALGESASSLPVAFSICSAGRLGPVPTRRSTLPWRPCRSQPHLGEVRWGRYRPGHYVLCILPRYKMWEITIFLYGRSYVYRVRNGLGSGCVYESNLGPGAV